ncbi:protein STICHEL-like 2 isoform X1 [Primulina huaijiensis]|uniref:protein STICHEL-like 2 isoform X1 n=2 Tax=Primulina huaijiensis TaxID=1492673 RepID=UPI003CC792B7
MQEFNIGQERISENVGHWNFQLLRCYSLRKGDTLCFISTMDVRRHSVDVPISRALIALKRVRSLRDPSTNSMSKLSSLVDSINWEKNLNNPIVLGVENGHKEGNIENNLSVLRRSRLFLWEERHVSDDELYRVIRRTDSRLVSRETLGDSIEKTGLTTEKSTCVDGSDASSLSQEIWCKSTTLSESYCKNCRDKELELECRTPSSYRAEGGGSHDEPEVVSKQAEKKSFGGSTRKCWRRKCENLSRVTDDDDIVDHVGCQCFAVSDHKREVSRHRRSLAGNKDGGVTEFGYEGCGINSCWSRTLKLRDSNVPHEVEEQILLLGNSGQALSTEENLDWKCKSEYFSRYQDSPRNLCQKFLPKSFNDLVGQNMVTRSLLNAISQGQIASSYLFHGPRGIGKTSASRIFAAALNCLSPEFDKPCGLCHDCILFLSGKSRDVREVDSAKINKAEKLRILINDADIPPVFSRFKVYIIDECHLLRGETWDTIMNKLEELRRQIVFIMVTPELDKLPRRAITKSQKYHFQKLKDVDIAIRLEKICAREGLEFDRDALNLVATKSNGSLREAEMMLDQLSLLGKKINVPLVYEANGVVSDDELLDLLYLALSSDASNTVIRARELMGLRIDPLQLVSQLANLIMDILAGKCPVGVSEVRRKLFDMHKSEADMQQLSHALKILSEAEKQLRMSKNQTTWLTAALLQLSSANMSYDDGNPRLSPRSLHPQGDFCSTSSTGECLKHLVTFASGNAVSGKTGTRDGGVTLELVWRRATKMCRPRSFKKFLQNRGKLVSVRLTTLGIAVAELEFTNPKYVRKTEKSWKMIASALQHLLGYNVELRINLANNAANKHVMFKKPSFSFFSCSRRVHLRSQFLAENGSNPWESFDLTPIIRPSNKSVEMCSHECESRISFTRCHREEMVKTIRNTDGNTLSIGVDTPRPQRALPRSTERKNRMGAVPVNKEINSGCLDSMILKPDILLRSRKPWKLPCWRAATFPFRKVSINSCGNLSFL